jgi:DNA replication regulator DPB11
MKHVIELEFLNYSGSKLYREEPDDTLKSKYRTECWLERCIFEERVCAPEEHVTFRPLNIQMPVAGQLLSFPLFFWLVLIVQFHCTGAEKLLLNYSGLDQSEVCFISRLLRALGSFHFLFNNACPHGS